MSFGAQLRAFKIKAMGRADAIVSETVATVAESLVGETEFRGPWTPLGDPESWKSPPPADYRPGNLRSSWFASSNAPSSATTTDTTSRKVHDLDLSSVKAGGKFYISNNAPHAGAIEGGHSRQAEYGILVNSAEFEPIVRTVARRIAT